MAEARELHDVLDAMLTERDTPEGKVWLTDHARQFLARMHRDLSHCEGAGASLSEAVLAAVRLNPHPAHWDDTCSFIRDLRLAIVATRFNDFIVDSLVKAAVGTLRRHGLSFDFEPRGGGGRG